MYRDEFLTCGYDGYVIMWDAVAHIDLWAVHLNGQVNKIQVRIYPKQKYLPPRKCFKREKNNAMIFIFCYTTEIIVFHGDCHSPANSYNVLVIVWLFIDKCQLNLLYCFIMCKLFEEKKYYFAYISFSNDGKGISF